MKSVRQLLRQPMKTLTGIVLVALAVAILCVCVGQAAAAANMRAAVEASYKTVALPTGKFLYEEDMESVRQWTDKLIEENGHIVLQDSYTGLASAWIPELQPDNYVSYLRSNVATQQQNQILTADPRGAPYTGALLEITLDSFTGICYQSPSGIVTTELRGTILQAVSLEAGYNDPAGYGIFLTLTAENQESMNALLESLTPGQRYLVYGMDYTDRDWLLRSTMIESTISDGKDGYNATAGEGFEVQKFTPENLFFFNGETEEEWQALIDRGEAIKNVAYYRQDFINNRGKKDYYIEAFTAWEMVHYYNKIGLTLQNYSLETGNSAHETPTIVPLSTTVEEFLASTEGKLWADTVAQNQINQHTFPIACVDDLRFVAEFATQNTTVTQGRIFTDEELASGAKVCIISDTLAAKNGLQLGDTIQAQFFAPDETHPHYTDISKNQGIINATADYYTAGATLESKEEYVIVGIYTQSSLWDTTAENLYAFTPNTIFVPKSSVAGTMKFGENGMFRTLLLKNGSVTEFSALLSAAGLESLFNCYDQGYSDLVENLFSYDMIARQALQIGLIVYAIVLGLYLLMFPGRQGKVIATMSSLGANRKRRICHIVLGSLGILLPGTVIGIGLGIVLRQEVLDALTQTVSVEIPLEMDPKSLILIGILQLLFASVVVTIMALPISRERSLMQKRSVLEHFSRLRKIPLYTWAAALLALIISVVLCALSASNEAEYANFEKARQEVPVTVTVTDPKGEKSTDMDLAGWVADVFSGEFNWGLSDYLKDVTIKMHQKIETVNGSFTDLRLQGIMSVGSAPELSPVTGSHVTWYDGFDESILLTYEPVCLVPEGFTEDFDPSTPEQEVNLYFYREWKKTDSMGAVIDSGEFSYDCVLTVVGTYVSTVNAQDIYAPYYIARTASTKLGTSPTLHSASATLKDNKTLEKFQTVAYKYFLEPGPDAEPKGLRVYGLKIEVGSLHKAEAVLTNSLTINRISTYLVFILSAGAGFFLGFLMIRSRKREIILMRTLGKPNGRIYLEFALEQMLRVLLGVAVGGAFFQWNPLDWLGWFVLIYFVGLSAALILFLNSRLITNMKEDE